MRLRGLDQEPALARRRAADEVLGALTAEPADGLELICAPAPPRMTHSEAAERKLRGRGHDARTSAAGNDRSMEGARTRIVIELLQGGTEPQGEVSVGDGPGRSFAGWIGLVAALEGIVQPSPAGATGDHPERLLPPGQTAGG